MFRSIEHTTQCWKFYHWVILLVFVVLSTTETLFAQPSIQTVESLVCQLDSNSFDEREEATAELLKLGKPAGDKLSELLPHLSNEAQMRGIYVLRKFAISEHANLEKLGEAKLKQLRLSENKSLARNAQNAFERALATREEIAMKLFRNLGATIGRSAEPFGKKMSSTPFLLSFGEQWKGKLEDLSKLRWLRSIREIEFVGQQFDDQLSAYLLTIPELHGVSFKKCNVTDETAKLLNKIKHLTTVEFYYCPITDASVKALSEIEFSLEFRFIGTQLSRAAAESLAGDDNLVTVDFRKGALLGVACIRDCIVSRIEPNSAADRAGIKPNDEILKFNGEPVSNIRELTKKISFFSPGESVEIQWRHQEQLHSAKVKLGQW